MSAFYSLSPARTIVLVADACPQ